MHHDTKIVMRPFDRAQVAGLEAGGGILRRERIILEYQDMFEENLAAAVQGLHFCKRQKMERLAFIGIALQLPREIGEAAAV